VSRTLIVVALILGGIPAFFVWANWATRRHYARFTHRDVKAVLQRALAPSENYDDWDLFCGWPIDDPYLDAVRQRCVQIWNECGERPSEEFAVRLKPILEELNSRQ
jgi:hypothetical protein